MIQNGLGYMIEEWFVECLQQDLRRNVAPTFWKIFEVEDSELLPKQLGKAVNYLHEITMGYMPCIDRLNSMAVILENRKSSTVFNKKRKKGEERYDTNTPEHFSMHSLYYV